MVAEGLRLDLLSGASRAEQNANVHRQMLDFGYHPALDFGVATRGFPLDSAV